MTVWTLQAGLPEMILAGGTIVRFETLSPTTGAAITGVTITSAAIYGYEEADTSVDIVDVVPLYTPEEV